MLAILGDLHGLAVPIAKGVEAAKTNPELKAMIQVGDLGWYGSTRESFYAAMKDSSIPVYWVDGNHENHKLIDNSKPGVEEIYPNFFRVSRGTVLEIDGRTIAFLGGASSVDKQYRLSSGLDWCSEEVITDEQLSRLDTVEKVDILITHCPPQSVIDLHFSRHDLRFFGLPTTWIDPCAVKVQALWERLGKPLLYCGHMHKHIVEGTCTILDINEVIGV